jgi:hypothetical protein
LVCQWLRDSTGLSANPYGSLFSLRNGFTAYSALSPVIGFLVTVAPKKPASQELDTSIEASEPHDFAVRFDAARPGHLHVHRNPPQRP